MYQTPEKFTAMSQANIETATRFAQVAFGGAERLMALQMKAMKEALSDSVDNAKNMSKMADIQKLSTFKETLAQPAMDKTTEYFKNIYEVSSDIQAGFGKLLEEQVAEFNKQAVEALDKMAQSAPAGSETSISAMKSALANGNSAFTNMTKAAKQFTDTAKSHIESAAATPTAKKAKK